MKISSKLAKSLFYGDGDPDKKLELVECNFFDEHRWYNEDEVIVRDTETDIHYRFYAGADNEGDYCTLDDVAEVVLQHVVKKEKIITEWVNAT
jgi:hypothetical protein